MSTTSKEFTDSNMNSYFDLFSTVLSTLASSFNRYSPITIPLIHARTPYRETLPELFDGYEGSRLVIPSVDSLCPAWRIAKNPHHESIYVEFKEWVEFWFKEERIRRKIYDLDAPLFASMAYPGTGRREVLTLAKFIAWYFPWDDAIDDGSLTKKPGDLIRYQDETIAIIKASLGPPPNRQAAPHPNPAIQSFWDLGTEIRSTGLPETNQQLIKEQCSFVTSSVKSQVEREFVIPVTVEQYLTRREENIAIYPLLALI
ncbi:hypothetical protein MMC25_001571 [Agyrium rufum]|nr:hypothetical protein [Agyrium rufum]